MTSAHIFFIPLVLTVGIILGIVIGRRSVAVQQAEEERQRRLAERRARAPEAPAVAATTTPAPAPESNQPPS